MGVGKRTRRGADQCRATMRDVTIIISMQLVCGMPRKINKAVALSLSSVRAYQNKHVSIYISFYLLIDFILFIKIAFRT